MPLPNILPPIDWPAIFASGEDYETWRIGGEYPQNQEKMEEFRLRQGFDDEAQAFLESLSRPVHVIVLAEDWCPDVVRHVPILQRMTEVTDKLKLSFIHRDTDLEVLVRFHTNGTESVPKFGFFNKDFVWCGVWGPLPQACNDLIRRGRAAGDPQGARRRTGALYKADYDRKVVIEELIACIDIAASEPWNDEEDQAVT